MRLQNLRDIELYMICGPNEPWKVCKKVFPHLVESHRMHNLKFSRQEQAFRGELLWLLLLSCCCYCCCCCCCGWAIVRRWSHFLAAVFVPVFLQREVLATYFDGRDEYATLVRAVKTFSSVISLSTKHNNDSNNSNINTTQHNTNTNTENRVFEWDSKKERVTWLHKTWLLLFSSNGPNGELSMRIQ